MTNAPRPLSGPLRARINRLAHARGLLHEMRQKALLLAQVQTARDAGAKFDDLDKLVTEMEAQTPGR